MLDHDPLDILYGNGGASGLHAFVSSATHKDFAMAEDRSAGIGSARPLASFGLARDGEYNDEASSESDELLGAEYAAYSQPTAAGANGQARSPGERSTFHDEESLNGDLSGLLGRAKFFADAQQQHFPENTNVQHDSQCRTRWHDLDLDEPAAGTSLPRAFSGRNSEDPGHVQWEAASFRNFAKEEDSFFSPSQTPGVHEYVNVGGGATQKTEGERNRQGAPRATRGVRTATGLNGSSAASVYEFRCKELEGRLASVEKEASAYADKLADMHDALRAAVERADEADRREQPLKAQVQRLQTEVRRNATNRGALEELSEQRLRAARAERDLLTEQLAMASEEIAMRDAALADSAIFMQELKRRNATLQQNLHDLLVKIGENGGSLPGARPQPESPKSEGVFGLEHIKEKIEQAVREAAALPESERKERIKSLRLRWHPDKNPVLEEFATEVTKIINEAVDKLAS
jgi:hypothetical protein